MKKLNLKKLFLYLLIASIAFSSLLGIGVILFGNFGEFEVKILTTALTVTVTSILGLACGAFLETRRGIVLPVCGIILSVAAGILSILFIWNAFGNERFFIRVIFTVTLLAAACSHLSLLSIARLDRKFRWSLYAAYFAVWLLTAILLWIIWIEPRAENELIPRLLGVLSIVIAALTIVTPIFHRLSGNTPKAEEIDAEIAHLKARIEELEKQKAEISNDAH